jgi:tRNA-binding EMAP/Myf-like protein
MQTKELISFSEFLEIEKKLDIRLGLITSASRIPKKDKLLLLNVSFKNEFPEINVVTNLGEKHEPEYFLGKIFPFLFNLEPSVIGGVESKAMILTDKNFEINSNFILDM